MRGSITTFLLRCLFFLIVGYALAVAARADEAWDESPSVLDTIKQNWTAEPFVMAGHTSALTRGEPFRPELDELTMDRLEMGVTFKHGKWEIDISQGWKCLDCSTSEWSKDYEESTSIQIRWYPWRHKNE